VKNILLKKLDAFQWVMGEGHTFGKNHAGNKNFQHNSEGKNDIYMVTAVSKDVSGRIVSSTEIRNELVSGRVDEAVRMLGHPYLIVAQRIAGVKRGSQIGYPTFNFACRTSNKVLPPSGIYAAEVEYLDYRWKGALYFGACPTFGGRERHFEFHAFDYHTGEPEYGREAMIWLHTKIRDDRVFEASSELTKAITQDIKNIKFFFQER
jgi:riboflavin kinase / FMN adenylyltransferase